MDDEKRKYPRLAANRFVRFYPDPFEGHYRQGMIKDYSVGGLRIITKHPLPGGSILTVELPLELGPQEMTIIQVRGVVRWVRRVEGRPGMGVEFLGSENTDFVDWMAGLHP